MPDEGPQVSDTTTGVNSPEAIASMVTLGWMGVGLYGVCLALILPLAVFLDGRERLAPV